MGSKKLRKLDNWINADPMAVKLSDKTYNKLDKVWVSIPRSISSVLVVIAILLMGLAVSGNWISISVHTLKQFGFISASQSFSYFDWKNITVESLYLRGFLGFWIGAAVVSFGIYYSIGGFIHWYFYMRQRDRCHEWKCQPEKFMPPDLELHEIAFGSFTLLINSTLSSVIACMVYNGAYSTVYYDLMEYPVWWSVLQILVIFLYQDYTTYWMHRIYHTPFLYKHFHKLHHKYKQPTAFSVTAIHPVESLTIQVVYLAPLYIIPVHWALYYGVMMYVYYHGIIDHSGVNFKAFWWQPWQPDAIFHDNHHQYFHVNFGFNISYWDKIHGTYRLRDRVYTEEIFYGKGKSLTEVSSKELAQDIAERNSENPLAYRDNRLIFKLTEKDILEKTGKKIKQEKTENQVNGNAKKNAQKNVEKTTSNRTAKNVSKQLAQANGSLNQVTAKLKKNK